jgi:hypothetical protein
MGKTFYFLVATPDAAILLGELNAREPVLLYAHLFRQLTAAARNPRQTTEIQIAEDHADAFREWLDRARRREVRKGDLTKAYVFERVRDSEYSTDDRARPAEGHAMPEGSLHITRLSSRPPLYAVAFVPSRGTVRGLSGRECNSLEQVRELLQQAGVGRAAMAPALLRVYRGESTDIRPVVIDEATLERLGLRRADRPEET